MKKNLPGILIGLISALALGFLVWLLYGRHGSAHSSRLDFLPPLNAACNATAAFLIVQGLIRIHHGDEARHRQSMLGAFAASSLFLVGYITYHAAHGDTPFPGHGWVRSLYFSILISHVTLSVVALPLELNTFYLALAGRIAVHRKTAKWTYPIWLYVSVTGVVVFAFLKTFAPKG